MSDTSSERSWTLGQVLTWSKEYLSGKGSDSPRLDAEILMAHALKCSRIQLYTSFEKPLDSLERQKIKSLLLRRAKHEPVAYILGKREFYSRTFKVTEDTLIPRPDSETLIDNALKFIARQKGRELRILDIGTGTGCLGITLALECPHVSVDLLDISSEALAIAEENVVSLQASNVNRLECADIFEWMASSVEKYDLIVSNPPYVSRGEMDWMSEEVKRFEPEIALYSAEDGLAFYRYFAENGSALLSKDGRFIVEIGATQAEAVQKLFEQVNKWSLIGSEKDFSGQERIIYVDL